MRREDRAVSRAEALDILRRGEHGVLSLASADGEPYGLPLNYCLEDGGLYFHCALEGRKLALLTANPRASFCVVGATEVLPDKFATRYESVITSGPVREALGEEKIRALEALLRKYSAPFFKEGQEYIRKLGGQTRVFRLELASLSGKARR